MLVAEFDGGCDVNICPNVVEGSSQCVIRRNNTSKNNILHVGRNSIQVFDDGSEDYISITIRDRLSYIPLSCFQFIDDGYIPLISWLNGKNVAEKPCTEVKHIFDMVHKHVCGHASFSDILSASIEIICGMMKSNSIYLRLLRNVVHFVLQHHNYLIEGFRFRRLLKNSIKLYVWVNYIWIQFASFVLWTIPLDFLLHSLSMMFQ